jgi:hypothetical protein
MQGKSRRSAAICLTGEDPLKPNTCLARARWLALLCAMPMLCACAGWTIHDESRAQLAAQGKQSYADAKVTEVADAEQKNLDYLLGEEIKVVRENNALQSDFAALAIASDVGPMAATYEEGKLRMEELGLSGSAQIRAFLNADLRSTRSRATLASAAKVLRSKGIAPPGCTELPTADPALPDDDAKTAYAQYRRKCQEIITAAAPPKGGLLSRAYTEWSSAQDALAGQQKEKEAALRAARDAAAAYRAAVERNAAPKDAAAKANEDLAAKEKELADALSIVKKLHLAGTFDDSIGALVDVLSAAAAGDTDTSQAELAEAAVVLKQLPALRTAAAELQASRTAIPVSGLLLELQRQTILADAAAKRQQLQEERVAILRAKYDGYQAEAQRWLAFSDAMCSYAVTSSGASHPGGKCDSFEVKPKDGKPVCIFDGKEIAACALQAAWKERLRASEKGEVKRELYKAAATYLQAIAAQAVPLEQSFREIDVRHRETLLARRSAIEGWNSIVSVPLDQLNAYYSGGIKPVELADLIVKALGFTAIAVGVSK